MSVVLLHFHSCRLSLEVAMHIDLAHKCTGADDWKVTCRWRVWPGFGPKTAVYHSLDSIGALFDEPTWAGYKVFDAYHPAARDIFWQYLNRGLYGRYAAFDIDNAYMFGTSLLVRPVFHPQSEEKNISVYLPKHSGKYWYDFWTGQSMDGGRDHVQANVLDVLPLYVKAGSILLLTAVKQYVMEHPDHELELRVYGGADASFLWYEDEGDSYRYEEGVYAQVPMQWDDAKRTLTIGAREGSYPGMPEQVKMQVKLYLPDGTILEKKARVYTGKTLKVTF